MRIHLTLTVVLVLSCIPSAYADAPATQPTTAPARIDVAGVTLDKDGKPSAAMQAIHAKCIARGKSGPIGVLFIGDSITAGWDGPGNSVYKKYFGDDQPANFGMSLNRTQTILWRIENGELDGISPKVVVLLIGTNNIGNTADDIAAAITKIVAEIHEKIPTTKVLLLGIFPRDGDPRVGNGIAHNIKIRTVNATIAKLDDGNKTRFLDIGDKFRDADGVVRTDIMPDKLHPSKAGYEIWAANMKPLLDEMMK